MIVGLPIPRRKRGGNGLYSVFSRFGRLLRPAVKSILRNVTSKSIKKAKNIGSSLIKDGGKILTKAALTSYKGGQKSYKKTKLAAKPFILDSTAAVAPSLDIQRKKKRSRKGVKKRKIKKARKLKKKKVVLKKGGKKRKNIKKKKTFSIFDTL